MNRLNKFLLLCMLICTVVSALANNSLQQNPQSEKYLKEFTSGKYRAKMMGDIYCMNDGVRYTMLSDDNKRIIAYSFKTGAVVDTIFDVEKAKNCSLKCIAGYEFDVSESRILIHTETTPIYRRSFTTNYYVYQVDRNILEPLSTEHQPQQMAAFSPNGRMVAFAYNNNLYLKKLDYNTVSAITEDGEKNKIINGTPDWVYEEEFGANRYFVWSPDSRHLAWIRFDESNIKMFSFDKYAHPYDFQYTYKYPKAGETNSTVSVHVYDIQNRKTSQMECGEGNDIYFPILKWSNGNDSLIVVRLNRVQTELEVLNVNPRSGVCSTLLRESDKVYVDYRNYVNITFLSDNSFITLSEKDGYRHIYHYAANGMLKRQITKGEWDVTDFYSYDEKKGIAYFQAAKEHPSERHVYTVDKKGVITNLDPRPGTHSAVVTKGNKFIISQFHNTTTANSTVLCDIKGKVLRTIIENKEIQALFDSYNFPKKEFIDFNTSEGVHLHGWIVKPTNFDPSKQYPLVMVQYSGPDSQEALNRFRPDWELYLAMEGYVVACVDSRGTGAKGHEFRTCTYWNLGQKETVDQIEAAKYFGRQEFIDKDRIAIWGWSYGGFMALNCLTYGNGVFKAGISVAPVTDWRLYNTAYTERFMATPQLNDLGYGASNLIDKANKLKGKLLICHGTADDNVHIQHTMLYVEQLVKAGKQFEMQIYPNKNHSILGADTRLHLYTRFNIFLKNNL
ncbi:MAG: S9 family peptidase [Candidatus Aphodosoma sp.]